MKNWQTDYKRYRETLRALLEKRDDIRAYLGILLSLFTVSFFGIFALRPTLTTIGELVSQINTQRETLATLDQKVKNLDTARVNLQKIRADLPVLDQALPTLADPHLVVRQMETLAGSEGVTPVNISIGKTPILGAAAESKAQTYPFSFTFQGDAPNILSFLDNLKTLRRIVAINEVTINIKSQTGSNDLIGSSVLQLIIGGDIPYYPKQ